MTTFTFSHTDDIGLTTNITFKLNTDAVQIGTFAELCNRAAKCFGWCEKNADAYLTPDEACCLLDDLGVGDDEEED